MIRIEDIKVGSVLQITKGNLYKIADSVFADKIDPLGSSNRIQHVKVIDIDIQDKKCGIVPFFKPEFATCVDIVYLAMYSIFSDFKETPIKKESEKTDADRFKEITDKMGTQNLGHSTIRNPCKCNQSVPCSLRFSISIMVRIE